MKKLNKKGFTLVELLAVIVVLAVIMLLAVNAVVPQMNKARKNAFVTEAQSVLDAAQTAYQSAMLSGGQIGNSTVTAAGGCISVADLKGQYLEKNDTNFVGSIKIGIDPTTNVATYTIWLSNGQYQITGITSDQLDETKVANFTASASTNCSTTTPTPDEG